MIDRLHTQHGWLDFSGRPLVMGILNITPDSFSDGGQFLDAGRAVAHARRMLEEGADIIDIGAESSRPGSDAVAPQVQIERMVPVIQQIRSEGVGLPISVDTRRAAVAEATLDAGADLVNDISALRDDPDLASLVAERGVGIILMHMQGTPGDMQNNPQYSDVVGEIKAFLRQRIEFATAAGIDRHHIIVDPGIGFGKRSIHNLTLLRRLAALRSVAQPILIGTSRKMFIGGVTARPEAADRLLGTAATVAAAVLAGAHIVRVHDVAEMREVVEMTHAIATAGDEQRNSISR